MGSSSDHDPKTAVRTGGRPGHSQRPVTSGFPWAMALCLGVGLLIVLFAVARLFG
ncbi:hypothetical protein [Microvirga splendida]|uniref:Uncharacterized protein n=1 Tax=Microvirga splendida TaxID=2795727 RepID=A0ABS0Y7P5_9HYPH|nr:hypothetical protein [Microvirga splendida]MBJ6128332.1 hypothetical protein [Microvirga splendida]